VAEQREMETKIRWEHQQWSKELPELHIYVEKLEQTLLTQSAENTALCERLARIQRAYELLLMLASEAGVSARELESLQTKAQG